MTNFRPAHEHDLRSMYEVFYQNEVLDILNPPAIGDTPSYLHHILQTGTMCVAEQDGEVLAFAGTITRGSVTFLTDLFVRPTQQSNQLGKTLLHAVLPQSTLTRCTESSSDPRALALYIREGMRPQWPLFGLRLQKPLREMPLIHDVKIVEADVNDSELIRWDAQISGRLRPLELDADFQDEEHFRDYCLEMEQNWQSCLAAEGTWLPQDVVYDISEITRLLPGMWERYLAKRFPTRHQVTFLHTDAYLANFLVPRTDEAGTVYMMDWQLPYGGIGAFDLVTMCAPFWTSAERKENKREETMLRLYLATLHAHGVTNYTWDQLLEDYRLMIIIFLQVAIWDQTNGAVRDYWWPKLRCMVSAARDFDCLSLLL